MTTMPTPAGPGTEKLIALVTNGSQFAGPAALLGLKHLNCQVYVHDPSFSDDARREAFASAHNGVIPVAGDRLSVANDVIRAEGRLDILIENPAPRGEAHVTDDDNVAALDKWLTDAAREVITEPFELLNFAARAMRQRSRGVIIFFTSATWDRPQHGSVYYSAMRAAYPCLALGAARDLASAGIQVNCVPRTSWRAKSITRRSCGTGRRRRRNSPSWSRSGGCKPPVTSGNLSPSWPAGPPRSSPGTPSRSTAPRSCPRAYDRGRRATASRHPRSEGTTRCLLSRADG
jgi:NAD(P)-dependent dehydrogenase (short-subunit alcohol dehydrogenase family)